MRSMPLRAPLATAALWRYWPVPAFFVLNSSLNMLNRWALGIAGFRFPLLLTCCHAAFGFLAMLPAVLALGRWNSYMLTLRRQWKGILTVGLCLAGNIALNNLSLVYISLSLNQIIRASIPVVTAVVAAGLDRRLPRRGEVGALLVLCSGVSLAIAEARVHGNTAGVAICMCGVLAGAFMLVASSRVMSEKLDVMQLAFFTSPVTCAALLPLVAVRESAAFRQYLEGGALGLAAAIILAGSIIAALYNMVHYAMVLTTSPVTTCVFGQAKIIGLLILSAAFLGETKEFTLRMSCGCGLALVGFGLYSWLKLQSGQGAAAAAAGMPHAKMSPAPSMVFNESATTPRGPTAEKLPAALVPVSPGAEGLGGTTVMRVRAPRQAEARVEEAALYVGVPRHGGGVDGDSLGGAAAGGRRQHTS